MSTVWIPPTSTALRGCGFIGESRNTVYYSNAHHTTQQVYRCGITDLTVLPDSNGRWHHASLWRILFVCLLLFTFLKTSIALRDVPSRSASVTISSCAETCMHKWMTYYNATACNDSWVRNWFPDGDYRIGELWTLQWVPTRPHTSGIP
jgi:hypothetical protein